MLMKEKATRHNTKIDKQRKEERIKEIRRSIRKRCEKFHI